MKKSTLRIAALFLSILFVVGCRTSAPATRAAAPPRAAPVSFATDPALPMPAGVDATALDSTVRPCDDFYRFACGGWLAKTSIPADRPVWGRGFDEIDERNRQFLKELLETLSASKTPAQSTPYGDKLANYYASCMDEPKLEQSLPTFVALLKPIRALKSAAGVTDVVAQLHLREVPVLFNFESAQDYGDARQVIAEIDQGGLSLPEKTYYLSDDPKQKTIRVALHAHIEKMLGLLGETPAAATTDADAVLAFETEIARASMGVVERREPKNLHHRLDRAGVLAKAPHFQWARYFKALGIPKVKGINVTNPEFVAALDGWLAKTPVSTWKAYLTWHFLTYAVPALPKAFQDAGFAFSSKAFTGLEQDLPRWKKCISQTDSALGEALARPYVEREFGPVAKEKTLTLVKDVELAFEKNLGSLAWMDAPTRERAAQKLHQITNKIGYPATWRSYDGLTAVRSSFLNNYISGRVFDAHYELGKIDKPLDRAAWEMTPPTVNAYYEPHRNEIVFPAGILQPPFFSARASMSVNAGAIGMVVGHEITHGFDDEGRHFDGDGNLKDWWGTASDDGFRTRAACVKAQFDATSVPSGGHVNGALTLGENVADLGGLKFALAAMEADRAAHPLQKAERFTPAQSFFLGYAQSWCSKSRPEFEQLLLSVDPHAPPNLRVNEPLKNLPTFQAAYKCKATDAMVSKSRCDVW